MKKLGIVVVIVMAILILLEMVIDVRKPDIVFDEYTLDVCIQREVDEEVYEECLESFDLEYVEQIMNKQLNGEETHHVGRDDDYVYPVVIKMYDEEQYMYLYLSQFGDEVIKKLVYKNNQSDVVHSTVYRVTDADLYIEFLKDLEN